MSSLHQTPDSDRSQDLKPLSDSHRCSCSKPSSLKQKTPKTSSPKPNQKKIVKKPKTAIKNSKK